MVAAGKRPVELSVDAREFLRVVAMAKEFDAKYHRKLLAKLRQAGEAAAVDVRREVKRAPNKAIAATRFRKQKTVAGHTFAFGRHELRQNIAKGVKVGTAATQSGRRVGVFLKSSGSDPASKALKRSWDREKGWRHPIFPGDRPRDTWTWAPQVGRPYFGSVIQSHTPQIEAAVKKVLADTLNELATK